MKRFITIVSHSTGLVQGAASQSAVRETLGVQGYGILFSADLLPNN